MWVDSIALIVHDVPAHLTGQGILGPKHEVDKPFEKACQSFGLKSFTELFKVGIRYDNTLVRVSLLHGLGKCGCVDRPMDMAILPVESACERQMKFELIEAVASLNIAEALASEWSA